MISGDAFRFLDYGMHHFFLPKICNSSIKKVILHCVVIL